MPGPPPGIHVLRMSRLFVCSFKNFLWVTAMHDIKSIRENPDAFDRALARRGLPAESKRLLAIDERRRAVIGKLEHAQARRNAASKEIGEAKKTKDEAAAPKLMAEVAELKAAISAMEVERKGAADT